MFPFLGIYKVRGNSMAPILKNDDYLLVLRNKFNWLPRLGSIVVVDHPDLGKIVKKVSSVDGDTFSPLGANFSSELLGSGNLDLSEITLGIKNSTKSLGKLPPLS